MPDVPPSPSPPVRTRPRDHVAAAMRGDADVGCGTGMTGTGTVEEAGARIFAAIPATVSGETATGETFDDGGFVPRRVGAAM